METKFQTSFIPKKPILAEQSTKVHGSVSILVVIGVLAFILSLCAAGGTIAWEKILLGQQVTLQTELDARKKQFNPELIEFLKRKNLKIDTAKSLLDRHFAVSDVFGVISKLTIENVRFKTFDFTAPAQSSKDEPKVTMSGVGASFSAIAFQADVMGRDNVLKNPIISNLSLEPTGQVTFSFAGTVSPADILYAKSLQKRLEKSKAEEEARAEALRRQQSLIAPPATVPTGTPTGAPAGTPNGAANRAPAATPPSNTTPPPAGTPPFNDPSFGTDLEPTN